MFDYFKDEEDIEGLMKEDYEYVRKKYEGYMKLGEKLNLLNEEYKKNYTEWFQEIIQEYKTKDTIDINNDI